MHNDKNKLDSSFNMCKHGSKMKQKLYDEINRLSPTDIISGHNGQDEWGKSQEVVSVLVHRRLNPLKFSSVFLPESMRVVYPVEMLCVDQYENHYYFMSCVLADGEVHTFCDRVRTNPVKRNYELQFGWHEGLWRSLRDRAANAIGNAQLSLLANSN